MSKLNPTKKSPAKMDKNERLAGGFGAPSAKQDYYSLLRRAVLACLLWENIAYETGEDNDQNISFLIPKVEPRKVADLAIECRLKQKLRSVPLFIACEMLKYEEHKKYVKHVLEQVITRPDQIIDFISLYWKSGRKMIPNQVKKALSTCFNKFSVYQLAKYDRNGSVKLRDVLFLCHARPEQGKEELFSQISNRTLPIPDTWEVALSTGKDKKETWTRLITEKKLGAFALLRNLRNMKEVNVDGNIIRKALKEASSEMLLPLNFFSAAKFAPEFKSDLNDMMLRSYRDLPKLPGRTIFIVDVSGSMATTISAKSIFNRQQVAYVMAMLALELCESVEIYCTAGNDGSSIHSTSKVDHLSRGFHLMDQLVEYEHRGQKSLGGGGIFTRQCLEYIKSKIDYKPDRIIVFSDSQDCDRSNKIPSPFGVNNYIVDVSSNKRGINYKNVWTAEISGWSENFLNYIATFEGLENKFEEND